MHRQVPGEELFRAAPRAAVGRPDLGLNALMEGSLRCLSSYLYTEGETDTYDFRLAFEHLMQESLDPAESREFILQIDRQLWALPAELA